jgi:catechol 2,3-dioxygenase-like lactoylglutathione lyase family enzyme
MFKVDHFALRVQDMDRALDFYTNKLGMEILAPREYNEEEKAEYVFLELDGGNLELVKLHAEPEEIDKGKTICPHIALYADNLNNTLTELKTKGLTPFQEPFVIDNVATWCYFKDSEGNILEFCQSLK